MTLCARTTQIGDEFEMVVVDNLSRTQLVMYAGASGDFHPFHHDEVYARAMGQPGIFAPGMLTMALAGRLLTATVGDGRLTHFGVRFRGQVWPGDTLTAHATVESLREEPQVRRPLHLVDLRICVVNQDGDEVLSGSATARIDA
jgi:acyl dehydratase